MKTIGSKVEDDIYKIFRLVCEKDGVTVSDRVKDLVNEFVEEEAPFIVLDQEMTEKLKQLAKEKGVDWKEMTCGIILKFCEKCSEEEEARDEIEEKAPVEEKKSKGMVDILNEAMKETEEKPKTIVDILTEGE